MAKLEPESVNGVESSMENQAGRIHLRAMARALPGTLTVVALCGLAACSTSTGQRLTAGSYRTGSTGEALSRAAASNPAAFSRAQASAARSAAPARTARSNAAEPRRSGPTAATPRRVASPPVSNAQAQVIPALLSPGVSGAGTGGALTPMGQPATLPAEPLVEQALTPGATLLTPAMLSAAPSEAARTGESSSRWALSPTQIAFTALGLALAVLAALGAAWSAARRKRTMAEPRIAPPVAANDLGPVPPRRDEGPQLALPLSPTGAAPRIYSASASARLSSR
jgi:hypothetical protein